MFIYLPTGVHIYIYIYIYIFIYIYIYIYIFIYIYIYINNIYIYINNIYIYTVKLKFGKLFSMQQRSIPFPTNLARSSFTDLFKSINVPSPHHLTVQVLQTK